MSEVVFPEEVPPSSIKVSPVAERRPLVLGALSVADSARQAAVTMEETLQRASLPVDWARIARIAAMSCGPEGVRCRLSLLKLKLKTQEK